MLSSLCFLVCSLKPCGHILWENDDLLALLSVVVYCVFITFPYGVLGQARFIPLHFNTPQLVVQ